MKRSKNWIAGQIIVFAFQRIYGQLCLQGKVLTLK